MTNDSQFGDMEVERLLRESANPVQDNGFSAQVLAHIKQNRLKRHLRARLVLVTIASTVGVLVAFLVLPGLAWIDTLSQAIQNGRFDFRSLWPVALFLPVYVAVIGLMAKEELEQHLPLLDPERME